MDNSFDVQIPWIIDDKTELALNILDRHLLGSKDHFVRFDLYPAYAPSHMGRHHGFWDIPLQHIKRQRVKLVFKEGELRVKNGWRTVRIKPVWKGDIEFIGYSMIHVSLWDISKDPPIQLAIISSQHVLRPEGKDLPPEHLAIAVTQRCNLKCPMCMRHVPENWNANHVSPEVLGPALEASRLFHSILIGGIGEPLLYENLFGVIGELRKTMPEDGRMGFNTNGTLMTEQTSSRLIDAGVNWITFSADGATKSTFERIRIGADFETVIRNIAHTVKFRNTSGRKDMLLQGNCVIQEENVREIPAFARLAGSLGLDSVTFGHLRDFKTGEFRMYAENVLGPLFAEAAEIGKEYGLNIVFPRLRPHKEPRCVFMQAAHLWLSGEVVPCCRMHKGAYPGPIRKFGNVREKPLLDIWSSKEYRKFRHGVLTRDFPDECKGCNYATGLLC